MADELVTNIVFKELIRRGHSSKDDVKIWNIAHSKLWYPTENQSEAFFQIEKSKKYKKNIVQKEIDLINEKMPEITKEVSGDHLNIIDLGCGDGKKAILFIKKLTKEVKLRYCPIDISSYMVKKALKNVKELELEERVKVQWNISDFENIDSISNFLRFKEYQKNFFLLLGNTLGEFEINYLLYKVRSSMKTGDILLIGNGLDNGNVDDILKQYSTKEIDEFLKLIPLKLGLKEKDIKFGSRFQNSRVELYYSILNDKTIESDNQKIDFKKGDQIIVGMSYKYPKKDFMSFLKLYFDDIDVTISKDNSYALALCKK